MAKKKCPKCGGKGCSHCGGTGYHNMNKGGMMMKKGYAHGGMTKKAYKDGGFCTGPAKGYKK